MKSGQEENRGFTYCVLMDDFKKSVNVSNKKSTFNETMVKYFGKVDGSIFSRSDSKKIGWAQQNKLEVDKEHGVFAKLKMY